MRAVQRDPIGLLLALADGKLTATRLPDVAAGAQPLHALAISGAGMKPVTVLLDPSTDLIRAQRYQLPASAGAVSEMEETFSDYRSIDGLQVAFAASVTRAGAPFVSRRVKTFEYNVALDPSLFVKPS
jgi:hypothetical protein